MKTYAFVIVGLALGACGESGEGGAKLSIAVAPLDLPRLTDACYDLAVFNAATPAEGDLVWEKADICASRYGDSQASIAYVGTCDATSTVCGLVSRASRYSGNVRQSHVWPSASAISRVSTP